MFTSALTTQILGRMHIGLGLPQVGNFADAAVTRRVAVEAEDEGFDSLWTLDRVLAPVAPLTPYPVGDGTLPPEQSKVFDPMLTLTLAAAVTDRVRLGTSVLIAPFYSPVMLARSAATLDHISGGRFTLGLGLGWSADEYAAIGVPQRGLQQRIEQMLEVMGRVWRDDIVEIETTRENVAPSVIDLKPLQGPRVPLILATYNPAGLERIARRADGWIPTGLPMAMVSDMWSTVLHTADGYGRDTSGMRLVLRANVKVTETLGNADRPDFIGSIAQIRGDIERARELGAHEILLDLQGTASSARHLMDLALTLAEGSLSPAVNPKAA